jgi:hypothetical protein
VGSQERNAQTMADEPAAPDLHHCVRRYARSIMDTQHSDLV